jgi:uncharacterized membrane protein
MNPAVQMLLGITMRWIHVVSFITLLGGYTYYRLVLFPTVQSRPARDQTGWNDSLARRFRPYLLSAIAGLVVSGAYNYLTKASYPHGYHMWMGIKLLLVLHVFAVSILYSLPADDRKRGRWAAGIIVSGLCITLISGYLRWISLNPPPSPH